MSIDPDDELLRSIRNDRSDGEFGDLGQLVRGGRRDADAPLISPPDDLWDRISAVIQSTEAARIAPIDSAPSQQPLVAHSEPEASRPVVRLQPRRATTRWWLGVAATIGLVVGVVGTLAVRRDSPSETPNETQVVQRANLQPLQRQGSGTAEFVRLGDTKVLNVRIQGLPSVSEGFYEVWLIDAKVKRLVSLGPLRADGHYVVPAGIDASEYPIVDVSLEALDGNPRHSSDSLLRGTLS